MTNSHPSRNRDASGSSSLNAFLTTSLCLVMPASLISFVIAIIIAGLPFGLAATETVLAAVFAAIAMLTGLHQKKNRESAVSGAEGFFWATMVAGLAGSVLSFFVLNLEPRARTISGLAAALLFLAAAALYVVWARLARRRPEGGPRPRSPRAAALVENFLLIAAAAFLFALSFPGFVFPDGFGPLAFVSLVPVFIVLGRTGWVAAACFGGVYGFLAHALFNFWLAAFNPLALTIVLSIRVVYYIVLFLILKLADVFFPRWAFLVQTLLWVGYEFLSAQGFIAYSYGIFGYSQYLFIPLLQAASVAGVWGLSLLVIFPGAYLGRALRAGFREALPFVKKTLVAPAAYAVVFLAALVYGFASRADTASLPHVRVACVQHNIDPWVGDEQAYEEHLRILVRLSGQADKTDPDLVIWPETALVPSLRYHLAVRPDQERYNNIIRPFLEFMDGQRAPYLIGNNDIEPAGKDQFGGAAVRSYNAALFLSRRDILGVYHKTHLVPFTEHFPYKDILPGVYNWLAGEDTHFYEAGNEADADKVFQLNDVRFSVLICFEDTFGEIARRFAARGADFFINLTNDAWSKSYEAEMQHLAIAVFRAVENRRSLVRCTTSGITSVVDPDGVITDRLPSFAEGVMTADVPVRKAGSPPAAFVGDWVGRGAVFAAVAGLALGAALALAKKRRQAKVGEGKANEVRRGR